MTQLKIEEAHIREAAYLLWLNEGQPEGRDQEHWQKAMAALNAVTEPAKPAPKAPAKRRVAAKKAAPKTATTAKPKAAPKTKAAPKAKAAPKTAAAPKADTAAAAKPKATTRKPRAKAAAKPAQS